MGTRQKSLECAETEAFAVLDVITNLHVLEVWKFEFTKIKILYFITQVSEVDQLHGSVKVLARVKLTWYEPNLAICACKGHNLKSKYRLSADFEDVIWTPDLVAEAPPDSDYLSLLRYLSFFSFR